MTRCGGCIEEKIGNNIGVDPSEIYECIALLRGHFGWLNLLTKVFKNYIWVNCYIIAKYKGEKAEAGGWDFCKPKNDKDRKFRIKIKDDKDAVMLKVWRKSELNRLMELVTNNKGYFSGKLSIQPDR